MLPPDTTQTVFLPLIGSLSNSAAATGVAPAPSAISFCFSIKVKIAVAISSYGDDIVNIFADELIGVFTRSFYSNAVGKGADVI